MLFWSKIDYNFRKSPNFGPQNGDFSKMWPSSRFGLAMAGIANIASTIAIAKFSQYYSEKNPTLQRKFRKIITKFRYSIVDAIFVIVLRNFCEFFYGCIEY
jgi:hypothetical protein